MFGSLNKTNDLKTNNKINVTKVFLFEEYKA